MPLSQGGGISAGVGGYVAVFDGDGILLWAHHFFGPNTPTGRTAVTDVAIRRDASAGDVGLAAGSVALGAGLPRADGGLSADGRRVAVDAATLPARSDARGGVVPLHARHACAGVRVGVRRESGAVGCGLDSDGPAMAGTRLRGASRPERPKVMP
jgi:hypothetical protein